MYSHYYFSLDDQQHKDATVHTWVPVSPPLLGAVRVIHDMTIGFDNIQILNLYSGLDFNSGELGIVLAGDLFPKDTYFRHADKEWMKLFVQRIDDEAKYPANDPFWVQQKSNPNYPFHFYPLKPETCAINQHCGLPVNKDHLETISKFEDTTYTSNIQDMKDLLDKYSLYYKEQETADAIIDGAYETGLQDAPNPGVQTALIFESFVPTNSFFDVYEDPTIYGKQNKFSTKFTAYNSFGDGTVTAWEALIPALKWTWEYDQNVENAKPVKVIEACSYYNQKMNVYDGIDHQKSGGYFDKNEYSGLMCDCLVKGLFGYPDPNDCAHSGMVADGYYCDFMAEMLQTHEVTNGDTSWIDAHDSNSMDQYVATCAIQRGLE